MLLIAIGRHHGIHRGDARQRREGEVVEHAGRARMQHLDDAEHRSQIVVARRKLTGRPNEVDEPRLERQPIVRRADIVFRRMRVGVDEPGHHQPAPAIEHAIEKARRPLGSDAHDPAAVDEDVLARAKPPRGAVIEHGTIFDQDAQDGLGLAGSAPPNFAA
jgi:hypothetical protein